ncbi:DUF2817 domain-containing protein [Deinococcus marmoris]|uniref:DUF2817 domain-containing protein n=1 Tax=Deinococcus marmoris TaxID=249408 RepID=UPI000496804F|nr:DUF2817 domain-containing protein [Deinococcus marmoris]
MTQPGTTRKLLPLEAATALDQMAATVRQEQNANNVNTLATTRAVLESTGTTPVDSYAVIPASPNGLYRIVKGTGAGQVWERSGANLTPRPELSGWRAPAAPHVAMPLVPQPIGYESGNPNALLAPAAQITDPAAYIALYETLRAKYPGYISRATLGNDQSGTYPIYRYVFEPPQYQKTIIITAGTHGFEQQTVAQTYLLMKTIADQWLEYPELAALRHSTRIVVMPLVSPWGLANGVRTNSRGVDPNRNFDFNWTTFVSDPDPARGSKGSAPFSELETQYVRDTLLLYPDAVAAIDYHEYSTGPEKFVAYMPPSYITSSRDWIMSAMGAVDPAGTAPRLIEALDAPTLSNWAAVALKAHTATLEWARTSWGGVAWGAEDMTYGTRWLGEVALRALRLDKPAAQLSNQAFVKVQKFRTASKAIYITAATSTEIPELKMVFKVPGAGVVIFEGQMVVAATSAGAAKGKTYLQPRLTQYGDAPFDQPGALNPSLLEGTPPVAFVTHSSDDAVIIPFRVAIPVNPGTATVADRTVVIGMYAYQSFTGGPTVLIHRYYATATFIPSESGSRFEVWSASDYATAGIGAMTKRYPS